MTIKRMVSTGFWTSPEVINNFTVEDRFFYLYLLTNPHTTQLGVYQIPKKVAAFEMGYSSEVVDSLFDRFENYHHLIAYDKDTSEVAVLKSLEHSIIRGGKPVEDLLKKELRAVKSVYLIQKVYESMIGFWKLSDRAIEKSIIKIFKAEAQKRNAPIILNDNDKENDNDNDNEISYPLTYDDTYNDTLDDTQKDDVVVVDEPKNNALTFYEHAGFGMLSPYVIEELEHWINDLSDELVTEALRITVDNAKSPNLNYAKAIMKSWVDQQVKSLDDVKALNKQHTKSNEKEVPDEYANLF